MTSEPSPAEIAACPFCGADSSYQCRVALDNESALRAWSCSRCLARGPFVLREGNDAPLIAAWNRRVQPATEPLEPSAEAKALYYKAMGSVFLRDDIAERLILAFEGLLRRAPSPSAIVDAVRELDVLEYTVFDNVTDKFEAWGIWAWRHRERLRSALASSPSVATDGGYVPRRTGEQENVVFNAEVGVRDVQDQRPGQRIVNDLPAAESALAAMLEENAKLRREAKESSDLIATLNESYTERAKRHAAESKVAVADVVACDAEAFCDLAEMLPEHPEHDDVSEVDTSQLRAILAEHHSLRAALGAMRGERDKFRAKADEWHDEVRRFNRGHKLRNEPYATLDDEFEQMGWAWGNVDDIAKLKASLATAQTDLDIARREQGEAIDRAEAMEADRNSTRAQIEAELDGNLAIRLKYGARENETMFDFIARLAAAQAEVAELLEVATWAMPRVSESITSKTDGGEAWGERSATLARIAAARAEAKS